MPGVLDSQPSSADKEKKGQRTEAPVGEDKASQRIRLPVHLCRMPSPKANWHRSVSASSGAGPNSEAVISASRQSLTAESQQSRSVGTAFLAPASLSVQGLPASPPQVWGNVQHVLSIQLLHLLLKRNIFDKLKTSLQ